MAATNAFIISHSSNAIPIKLVTEANFAAQKRTFSEFEQNWITTHNFSAKLDTFIAVPSEKGGVAFLLVGVKLPLCIWSLAHIPAHCPAMDVVLVDEHNSEILEQLAIGFSLAQYQFTRYKSSEIQPCRLVIADTSIIERATAYIDAINLSRDLINTPTNDMGPTELANAAREIAESLQASFTLITGEALLEKNYPAIHAVGRAATNPPCLIDMRWGNADHPSVTLVGKGVCFDTGGLDIKPYSSMKLMKKDMGGAALMLGLFQLIVINKLPIQLRLLIPAVENAIAGNAYRPQDIVKTRKGLTVEIGSTDAEGRVILADALYEADSESPDLIIDAATLTGAARTALGAELPALFSSDREEGEKLVSAALRLHDPMWQMPLWDNYDRFVKSPIADITNSPHYAYAGAITAALFLRRFISEKSNLWMHIDTMAWNVDAQPGRPVGGEALGLRALYSFIASRYKSKP